MNDITDRIAYLRDNFFEGNNSKFAEFVGTSEANIRNYCKSIVPKTEFLIALAMKLEINFDWLMLGIEPMKRKNSSRALESRNNINDDDLRYIIELQKEIIEKQKIEIEILKKNINKSLKK